MKRKIATALLFMLLSAGISFGDDGLDPGKPHCPTVITTTTTDNTFVQDVRALWNGFLSFLF
jgi:hypothetical protein